MEDELNLICDKCGKKTYFCLGKSFIDGEYFKLSPSSHKVGSQWSLIHQEDILSKVSFLMDKKKGYFDLKNYGYELYYSPMEECLKVEFFFTILFIDKGYRKFYNPIYKDSEGNKLFLFNKIKPGDNIKVRCPKCNEILYQGKKEYFFTSMQLSNRIKFYNTDALKI